jgi:hypothetical protein
MKYLQIAQLSILKDLIGAAHPYAIPAERVTVESGRVRRLLTESSLDEMTF